MKTILILIVTALLLGCTGKHESSVPPTAEPSIDVDQEPTAPASNVRLQKVTTREDGKNEFTMQIDLPDRSGNSDAKRD